MLTHDIQALIVEAQKAVATQYSSLNGMSAGPSPESIADYKKCAEKIYGLDSSSKLILPKNANTIVARVQKTAHTLSTLKKLARSVRYAAVEKLQEILILLKLQAEEGRCDNISKITGHDKFKSILTLASLYPEQYKKNWKPARRRMGKKNSYKGLPGDWWEQLIPTFSGQFKIPSTIVGLTGMRPSELRKGVHLHRDGEDLIVSINGAKVTEFAGQEVRVLKIRHPLKSIIFEYMDKQEDKLNTTVFVKCSNSVTTHIRAKAQKLYPYHRQAITCYSFRHAIASDQKGLIAAGMASHESISMLLGHRIDKTASFYGHQSKSGSGSMAPTPLATTHPVKRKLLTRNMARLNQGLMPMKRRKLRRTK